MFTDYMNAGLTNDQSLLTEGEDWSFDKGGLRSGSREGVYVREDWDLESGTLNLSYPCFAGQRHPMSSMMETMTMTRKVMWRFKSSCVSRNSFLPLG